MVETSLPENGEGLKIMGDKMACPIPKEQEPA